MDSNPKQHLLDKYWKAETSTDEESVLKNKAYELNDPEKKYFQTLDQFDEISIGDAFSDSVMEEIYASEKSTGWSFQSYWKVAAAIVILIISSLLVINFQEKRSEKQLAQKEAREAFEMTKQALMLVSVQLNKGTDYTSELGRFDEAKQKLTN